MRNPFNIPDDTNVVLSVSGGRTSGYVLAKVLEAHGGSLPDNCYAIFQNTGKEKSETYDFLSQMEMTWGVKITWLEYSGKQDKYKIVDFDTADRSGAPFELFIEDNSWYLPNNVQRGCTRTLKSKVMSWYLADQGVDEIENWIGIRADEPRRFGSEGIAYEKDKHGVVKRYADGRPKPLNKIVSEEKCMPLRHAGVIKKHVIDWWKSNSFDLQLGPDDSNCDLCYLKAVDTILSAIRRDPSCVDWWIAMEDKVTNHRNTKCTWRYDRPSYRELKKIAEDQPDLFFGDARINCVNCTD